MKVALARDMQTYVPNGFLVPSAFRTPRGRSPDWLSAIGCAAPWCVRRLRLRRQHDLRFETRQVGSARSEPEDLTGRASDHVHDLLHGHVATKLALQGRHLHLRNPARNDQIEEREL